MPSTQRLTSATFSPASPTTRSTASANSYHGTGKPIRPRSLPDAYHGTGERSTKPSVSNNILRLVRPFQLKPSTILVKDGEIDPLSNRNYWPIAKCKFHLRWYKRASQLVLSTEQQCIRQVPLDELHSSTGREADSHQS
jgi:hypothetical protein